MSRVCYVAAIASIVLIASVPPALAADYYIGQFAGSTPADDPSCGTGLGSPPLSHPCSTLAYWTSNRNVAGPGDTVRLAPGLYTSSAGSHCIDIAKNGVTYRGSAADGSNTTDRSQVVIVGSSSGAAPCRGTVVKFTHGTSTDVTIRDLTVLGCPNADNGTCMEIAAQPGAGSLTGLTVTNIRVTQAANAGLWVGAYDGSPGPNGELSEPFNMSDVTITDSEFDGNCFTTGRNGSGLQIAAVDGGVIARNKIHNNIPCATTPTGPPGQRTCTRIALPPSCPSGGCNCDGLHVGGKNFVIEANEIYRNEEDGIDLGPNGAANDCPLTTARFHTVQNNLLYDNGVHNFSMNGCANGLTVRNNFIWGTGTGINQYECAGFNSKFYNNTVVVSGPYAVMAWSAWWPFEAVNNIFISDSPQMVVYLDYYTTQSSNKWENNVVWNSGSGYAIRADFVGGDCRTGSGTNCCLDPHGPSSLGSPVPGRGRTQNTNYTNGNVAAWRSDGDAGHLFGGETGDTDVWTLPTFVNIGSPSVNNLHLSDSDTAARDNGQPLTGFNTDYNGATRPGGSAWDIGAHELSGGVGSPILLDVRPLP